MKTNGWVATVRKMKNWAFADIQTGLSPRPTSVILSPQDAEKLHTGACVEVSGTLQQKPKSTEQELKADKVHIWGPSGPEYPLQKKYHSPEYVRQMPQFRWRTRTAGQVLRYRSWAISQISEFYRSMNVFQVNSPLLTSSDCEGAGEVFSIKKSEEFFGKTAYLSVSSQLHLEVYCQALARVWNLAPAFRAEASDTNRHLSEFWMVEAELAFMSLPEVLQNCQSMVRACVPSGQMAQDLLDSKRDPELRAKLEKRWGLLNSDWQQITYTKAIALLQSNGFAVEWGCDLSSEHEKWLSGEHFAAPTFVTHYPKSIKPFYMKASDHLGDQPGQVVECFDLLIPELGELVGGSMREDNYDTLLANIKDSGMNAAHMQWYTDLRRFGSFPHGGYGLGFERLIMYTCGLDNIRDATGFIRHAGSLQC